MTQPAQDLFTRYQPWQRFVEPGFWIGLYVLQASLDTWSAVDYMNSVSKISTHFEVWQTALRFFSNNLVLLAWVPAVLAFEQRFPLRWALLYRNLPYHFLATLVYSITHVLVMVGLMELVYRSQGALYVFEDWPTKLTYEYLKDFRAYFFVIIIVNFYRLLLLRWQGEASLLDVLDDGSPVDSAERPGRILVRQLGKEYLLPTTDIEWIQACGNYVNLRVRGHNYPLRSTMAESEIRLDPKRFIRVHRSYIANLDHVLQLEPLDSGDARANMTDGSQVPVSRRYIDTLRKASAG